MSYNCICTKNAVAEVVSLNWINLLAVKFHFYLWGRIQPLQDVKTKKTLNLKVTKGVNDGYTPPGTPALQEIAF